MKKNFLYILLSVLLITPSALSVEKNATPKAEVSVTYSNLQVKQEISRLNVRRMLLANALRLSEEQKKQARELYQAANQKEAILLVQLKAEQKKLKQLCDNKATLKAKHEQKKNINKLECALAKTQKEHNKAFLKILTRQQKTKFKALQKELPY